MHRCQHLVHPSKQFWNWFCGMAFRAAVVLFLISSMSSKCLPFNISFIFGNRKKSRGARSGEYAGYSNTVICLVAKNSSQTVPCEQVHCHNARSMSCWQEVWVVSVFFTQPFCYFQIVNLVDCLSSWYKFIMNNPSNIKKSQQHCVDS